MDKLPFTSYDFWAYLSAGFLLLFGVDYVARTHLFERDSWTIVQGVVAVTAAYAVGHIVAQLSSLTLERVFIERVLGAPRDALFGRAKLWGPARRLMPRYFTPLSAHARAAVYARAGIQASDLPTESLFQIAYQCSRDESAVAARLGNFLNQYGFCRNTAFVAFVHAALLFGFYRWGGRPEAYLYWSRAALVVGIAMTARYLKFYHLYAREVFTAYGYGSKGRAAA